MSLTLEQRALKEIGQKWCPTCQTAKSFSDFYGNRSRHDGMASRCKPCAAADQKERQAKWPQQRKDYYAARRYGLTSGEYDRMLEAQEGLCAACGDELQGGRFTHIDHCHESGTVRGILCIHCNLALGYLKDDIERIDALRAYLVSPNGH